MEGGEGLKNGIANAQALLGKGLRRDHLLLSSGRHSHPHATRSPEDFMAFATLLGLKTKEAATALSRNALAAIAHGKKRRRPASERSGGVSLL